MLPWIFLFVSGFLLFLIFFRRLRMTQKDLHFQRSMEAESREEEPAVEPDLAPEETVASQAAPAQNAALLGSVRKTFLQADTHFSRQEYEHAEPLFLAILEADPQHLEAHQKLGLLYMKQGRFPQAELYFSRLVSLKQDAVYLSNLGATLYQQQRLVEAAEIYERALALDDKRSERLQSLGQVYYELGDDEKALYFFERAAQRKPKNIELKLILADYYERLVFLDKAIQILEEALHLDPYNKDFKKRLSLLRKKAGQEKA